MSARMATSSTAGSTSRSTASRSRPACGWGRAPGALVTACLTRVPDPLEFGIVIQTEDGRIERFLEKPTWGQVFSDTVNTGIYVMEPEVFAHVEPGRPVDWSGDVFPAPLGKGAPLPLHRPQGQ